MSRETPPRARARIDLAALVHNYALAARCCPQAALVPVVKADAYGHGMEPVARALVAAEPKPVALAVATLDEALALDGLKLDIPALLLGGCIHAEELAVCLNAGIEPVIHSEHQIEALRGLLKQGDFFGGRHRLWLKMNTGMNRLGLHPARLPSLMAELRAHQDIEPVLMSHLACADEGPDNPALQRQLRCFAELHQQLGGGASPTTGAVPASLAASAAIMSLPDAAYHFARPGIMLYGASPLVGKSGPQLGLRPVMSLCSRLIAVNQVAAGESVGYGAAYTCTEDSRVGVVSIGYADGYPRSAPSGTPLLVVSSSGCRRTRLLGRVSMDLLTIDLNPLPEATVGDEVILWGQAHSGGKALSTDTALSADKVATQSGTIAYELFCRVGSRVTFEYQ